MSALSEPQIVEFGPYRIIGMSYKGKNEQGEVKQMWGEAFMPRIGEIATPAGEQISFGVCRCIPGVSDGTFEYIAALPATADAVVPEGMVEAQIPATTYAVFPVKSLEVIMEAWGMLGPWLEAHPEWEGYCTPAACDCEHYPTFELYPADFCTDGQLFIYMPVRRKRA